MMCLLVQRHWRLYKRLGLGIGREITVTRPGDGGKSSFEVLFGMKTRFAYKPPQTNMISVGTELAREFELA